MEPSDGSGSRTTLSGAASLSNERANTTTIRAGNSTLSTHSTTAGPRSAAARMQEALPDTSAFSRAGIPKGAGPLEEGDEDAATQESYGAYRFYGLGLNWTGVAGAKHKHWTPDRGGGYYGQERVRSKIPALVDTGVHAGKSRVKYTTPQVLFFHEWTKDFFISALNTKFWIILVAICIMYACNFLFFSGIWWAVHLTDKCVGSNGDFVGYPTIYIFSLITTMTIGYGSPVYPGDCASAAIVLTIQSLIAVLMDAVTLGILFARISHPKYGGRTIGISDTAVISRRDGILKLMFRIIDFRRAQVVEPKVRAYLYTWGGRWTVEGERIPVRAEALEIGYIDGMMLLPLIVEHTIDERSPLMGHSHDSLVAVNAEIIVTFEGTTESGNPFLARQSYLPSEIKWGHKFSQMIRHPQPGDSHYVVDITRLHKVEPLPGLRMGTPSEVSLDVISRATRSVPYPLLGENTLVLSDTLVLAPDESGRLSLLVRVGDTYPNQHLEVMVKMYLYRWRPSRTPGTSGLPNDYDVQQLEVGYEDGRDRLLLWLPTICKHVLTPESPIAKWATPEGYMSDADSVVVVTVEGYQYQSAQNRLRMRMYSALDGVRRSSCFAPIVTRPSESPDFKPRINWARFHSTLPMAELRGTSGRTSPADFHEAHSAPPPGAGEGPPLAHAGASGTHSHHLPPESFHAFLTPNTDSLGLNTFQRRARNQRPRITEVFSRPSKVAEGADVERSVHNPSGDPSGDGKVPSPDQPQLGDLSKAPVS